MHIAERLVSGALLASTEDEWGKIFARAARRKRWAFAAAAVVVVLGAAAFVVPRLTAVPTVSTFAVRAQAAERILAVSGRVRPPESVSIVPKVSGEIVDLQKSEGETVAAGEYLGRIDDARARAAVTQAAATAAAQKKVLDQAERDLARTTALVDRGIATTAASEAASLAVTRARDDLRRLESVRDEAALRLEEYKLVAPIAGRVLTRPVDRGQVVDGKSVIFEIAPTTGREVETEVDEAYSMALAVGQPARLAFAGVTTPVEGNISYLSPRIDTSTGGRLVRLSFAEPANLTGELPVGLSVDVNIIVERRDNGIVVPRAAIRDRTTAPHVLVVADGVIARHDVTFKDWPSADVLIDTGVAVGDAVVTTAAAPAPGTAVTIAQRGRR